MRRPRSESYVVFRILLVEDDPDVAKHLGNVIENRYPRVAMDRAEAVDTAMNLIGRRLHERTIYDLAILDLKLPSTQGENPEVDTRVCAYLRQKLIPIIHVTAFPTDPLIRDHMAKEHAKDKLLGQQMTLVRKTVGPTWGKEIIGLMKGYYEDRISLRLRESLSRVFGSIPPNVSGSRRGLGGGDGFLVCGTHALIQIEDDIRDTWSILSEEVRKEIRSIYATVVEDDQAQLQLLALFPPEPEGSRE